MINAAVHERFLLVLNPNAGGKKGGKDWPLIEKLLNANKIPFDVVFTKYRGHAIKLTSGKIEEGYRKIIVTGGDGTVNEVVNGIFTKPETAGEITLGVIMIGTGNDWGRMFNIPDDYENAVKIIAKNKTFKQDVGRVSYFLGDKKHYRYFVNAAGIGFDALVVEKTNESKDKGRSGKFAYLTTLFKTLMRYKHPHISISVEGRPLNGSTLFTMSVGIGKFSGGGMQQVPNAVPDDGLFDIMLVNKISKSKIIRKIKKLYDGNIESIKEVNMLKGKKIVADSSDKVLLEVDGESLGHNPFEFEIIDKKLKIIVN